MKKFLVVLLAVVLMTTVFVGMASANAGPHGGYTGSTDACAGCHRAHTGTADRLLVNTSIYGLCTSCHGSTATGSALNVIDGVEETVAGNNTGAALNGGGFYVGATSMHDADGTTAAAWGNTGSRGTITALTDGNLQCSSCHDPHGSTNYRILKTMINGNTTVVTQVDEGAQVYDAETWPADMSNVCAACHSAYHITASGSGSDILGLAATGGTAHTVDVAWNNVLAFVGANNPETHGFDGLVTTGDEVPLAGADLVTCNTCHFSHGTNATMSALAQGPNTADSMLMRLDNRDVCQACHQK